MGSRPGIRVSRIVWGLTLLATTAGVAEGRPAGGRGFGGGCVSSVGAAASGWPGYGSILSQSAAYYYGAGSYGYFPYPPPMLLVGPGGGGMGGSLMGVGSPWPPWAPLPLMAPAEVPAEPRTKPVSLRRDRNPEPARARSRKSDPDRALELMTFGDRHFRNDDLHRAQERYEQALEADPDRAVIRVRLAQVAILRGDYIEAANRFREAYTTEPRWLDNPEDVQALYPEPADYRQMIAQIESHLQSRPGDRDAWFVLGAQWLLAGRPQRARDILLRLTDETPDSTLRAFLKASRSER